MTHAYDLNTFLKKFGQKLKDRREENSLTQEQCAELTGIEYKYFQRIEQGQTNITLKTIHKICQKLNINPKDLF